MIEYTFVMSGKTVIAGEVTRAINTKGLTISSRIIKHFEYLMGPKSPFDKSNRSIRGKLWQICVADGLASGGMRLGNIVYGQHIVPEKKIEADILLFLKDKQYVALHCKTSFRERWQQADRAAMYTKCYTDHAKLISHYMITYKEHSYDTNSSNGLVSCRRTLQQCVETQGIYAPLWEPDRFDMFCKQLIKNQA